MPHRPEAVDLVRALAGELAGFSRRPDATGRRHVGIAELALCHADPVYAVPSGCSPRCERVRQALEMAARWLGVDVSELYAAAQPPRRGPA